MEYTTDVLALTKDQQRAFNRLKRAFKQCKDTGILFYVVLDVVSALNGEHVEFVHDSQDSDRDVSLQYTDFPCFSSGDLSGWADDTHFARLR